jgi:hypothetical protein
MSLSKLKAYRIVDLKRGMRESGLYGPYLSEMKKSEVYCWISKNLTVEEVLRVQECVDNTLQSKED